MSSQFLKNIFRFLIPRQGKILVIFKKPHFTLGLFFLLSFVYLIIPALVQAANVTSTQSGDWHATSTWDPPQIPGPGDTVTIKEGHTVTVTTSTQIEVTNLTIESGALLSADGEGEPGATSSTSSGSGTGKGKASTGIYSGGGGAGYGGYGGAGADSPQGYGGEGGISYGSGTSPSDLGSGGGTGYSGNPGGSGGGIIRLNVANTLSVYGGITANGENGGNSYAEYGGGGGGSGGSINITTETISGTGYLHTKGGNGGDTNYDGGGGAGGRIAVYYEVYNYSGTYSASGGTGYESGENGTIYHFEFALPVSSITDPQDNTVKAPLLQIKGTAFLFGGSPDIVKVSITDITGPENQLRYNGTTWTTSTEELWLDATNDDGWADWHYGETLDIWTTQHEYLIRSKAIHGVNEESPTEGNSFIFWDGIYINRNKILHPGTKTYSDNLWISGSSTILCESSDNGTPSDYTDDYGVTIIVQGNFILDESSKITADEKGYAAKTGPGKGSYNTSPRGSGGSHAGYGGDAGGLSGGKVSYGNPKEPITFGSGGGQGAGGGAIKLNASSTITINGTVSANGGYGTGSGAGGSVWIIGNSILGSGDILANGGESAYWGAGGGGGRVAIYYTDELASSTLQVQAYGGTPGAIDEPGGAGTLFIKKASASNGDLFVDNNNYDGELTPQVSNTSWVLDNLSIKNKAKYVIPETSTTTLTTLNDCTSNSSLTNNGVLSTSADLTISNLYFYQNGFISDLLNLTIDSGATFEVQNNFPDINIFDESAGTGNGSNKDFKLAHYNKPNSQIIRVSGKVMEKALTTASAMTTPWMTLKEPFISVKLQLTELPS